jgi:hypothetical protein
MSTIFLFLFSSFSVGTELAHTEFAQRIISFHQNPANCSTARWLSSTHVAGFGSVLHVNTAALAYAMNRGAILVWEQHPLFRPHGDYKCAVETFDCIFEQITNCTQSMLLPELRLREPGVSAERMEIPNEFANLSVVPYPLLYWWRAQATNFFVKVNPQTKLRLTAMHAQLANFNQIPCGTICVHVRHGDKGSEAPLLNWERFLAPIRSVAEMIDNLQVCPDLIRRHVLVLSDDVDVLAKAWVSFGALLLTFNDNLTELSTSGKTPYNIFTSLVALHSVVLCASCSGFVLQRTSNLARLIDERRLTNGGARSPFVEVGDYTFDWK